MSGVEITEADRERANLVGGLTMERRAIVAEEFAKHRIAAIEECAKVAEEHAVDNHIEEASAAFEIASQLRALTNKPQEG